VNLQEYISSGIIESYVLGLANLEEQREFEQLCSQYPELLVARENFELELEKHSLSNQVAPPVVLKENIWNKIKEPQVPVLPFEKETGVPVIPQMKAHSGGWLKYAAAASIILLLGSTLLNFYFYQQYNSYSARYDALFASTQQMANTNKVLQVRNDELQSGIRVMKDTGTQLVALKGTAGSPNSLATVYWNKTTSDVYMLVNNLPTPGPDQQYQLWAFVDGRPVDAGFLNMQTSESILKMKNFARAEVFAITLEQKGRKDTSAPSGMVYVLGKT
jgi:anti-sigma-K factor RskA